MKHVIKHRDTGAVLFEGKVPARLRKDLRTRHVLHQAIRANADLAGADFAGADLAGVNFGDSINFGATDLTGANFAGSHLSAGRYASVNLVGSNLSGATFTNASWRHLRIKEVPLQTIVAGWLVTILDAHMQVGCSLQSLAEWESFDDQQIAEIGGRSALRFLRDHKDEVLSKARAAGRSFEPQLAGDFTTEELETCLPYLP